jgi:uncharacterized membrane protein YhaH (DUF805 family)
MIQRVQPSYVKKLFALEGSVSRLDYWKFLLVQFIASIFLVFFLKGFFPVSEIFSIILAVIYYILIIYMNIVTVIKRLKDTGFSDLWSIVICIPVLGFLFWLLLLFYPSRSFHQSFNALRGFLISLGMFIFFVLGLSVVGYLMYSKKSAITDNPHQDNRINNLVSKIESGHYNYEKDVIVATSYRMDDVASFINEKADKNYIIQQDVINKIERSNVWFITKHQDKILLYLKLNNTSNRPIAGFGVEISKDSCQIDSVFTNYLIELKESLLPHEDKIILLAEDKESEFNNIKCLNITSGLYALDSSPNPQE